MTHDAGKSHHHELVTMVGQEVVLDTASSVVYLGRLMEVTHDGFWLADADVHDCRDGHAGKELYICEARTCGVRAARQRVYVFSHVVTSASLLSDVIVD